MALRDLQLAEPMHISKSRGGMLAFIIHALAITCS